MGATTSTWHRQDEQTSVQASHDVQQTQGAAQLYTTAYLSTTLIAREDHFQTHE